VALHDDVPMIPEVIVFYGFQFFLGSRIVKSDATDVNAFTCLSPRLGTYTGEIQQDRETVRKLQWTR
jgi:hypothetical protein